MRIEISIDHENKLVLTTDIGGGRKAAMGVTPDSNGVVTVRMVRAAIAVLKRKAEAEGYFG